MVEHEINQSEEADHGSGEECAVSGAPANHVEIEAGDEEERADPNLPMPETKFLSQRARRFRFQGRGIYETLGEVDQPSGQKKRDGIALMKGHFECAREEPEPGDRNYWRIQANKIEPDNRLRSAWGGGRFLPGRRCQGMRLLSFQSPIF